MPLPQNDTIWPPNDWLRINDTYAEHAAWYASDLDKLAVIYSSRVYSPYADNFAISSDIGEEVRQLVHVPAASDLSSTSAALLFSEHPKFKIAEAHAKNAPSDAIAAQSALESMIDIGVYQKFSEAADSAAGIGGIILKVNWDDSLSEYPILDIAQADNAIMEFKFGMLSACTLWNELENDGSTVLRRIERHEPGSIETGLYRGSINSLGTQISLDNHPSTKGMPDHVITGLKGLACVYIPNMRPYRKHRDLSIGQSDYAGCETLMYSLDTVFTSLMRDIVNGLGRIAAPAEYFEYDETDKSMKFNLFKQAYLKLNAMEGSESSTKDNITLTQFDIRSQQHIDTSLALLRQIYVTPGYSPQTFGMDIQGSAESGTALTIRERKSLITAAKKGDYWRPALEYMGYAMQVIYQQKLKGKITPYPVQVEMQDSVQTDINQVAQSVELISRAAAASKMTLIQMLHPDWSAEQVQSEVDRIMDEQGLNVPDPATLGRGNE
jgi:hypothetical protein